MRLTIDGSTDVYLILGQPVAQVRAPEAFNALFAQLGRPAVLVPAEVAPADLAGFVGAALRARNIRGLWVTIPHKEAAAACVQHLSPLARAAGAVNAVRRRADGSLEGALFDGEGFVRALARLGTPLRGRRVLVLGAGGAAAAIGASMALCAQPPACIAFHDPAEGKAQALVERLRRAAPAARGAVATTSDPAGFDLVVNASPLGLRPADPLPFDVVRMDAGAAFVDILMKNQPTPALRAVRSTGRPAHPGFEMMVHQADLYLDFFGLHAAAEAVRQDCRLLREQIYPPEMAQEWQRLSPSLKETAP